METAVAKYEMNSDNVAFMNQVAPSRGSSVRLNDRPGQGSLSSKNTFNQNNAAKKTQLSQSLKSDTNSRKPDELKASQSLKSNKDIANVTSAN